jgi:phage major head subunit gpT-like protein
MELSAGNLTSLFTGWDMAFARQYETTEVLWTSLMRKIPSSTLLNQLPFMAATTKFREWVGSRIIQNAEAKLYQLLNRHFEDTIGVKVDDIEDDIHGVYGIVFEMLGIDAKTFPDMMLGGLLQAAIANIDAPAAAVAEYNGQLFGGADVVSYDGKTMFSASHPVGPAGFTSAIANVYTGGSSPYWFLWDASRPITPAFWQEREAFKLVRMDSITDEKVFNENMFRFGIDGRGMIGVGPWQLCYSSNADLSNPANYGAAIAAMRSFKKDNGQPYAAWSGPVNKRFLIVPNALEEVARQLLTSEFGAIEGAGGAVAGVPGTNIWRGSATLIVNPYLGAV